MRLTLALLAFSAQTLLAQTPKITGTLAIDLSHGQITADLTLTNFPKMDNPAFCLNRGMNIKDLQADGKSIDYNLDWGFPGRSLFLSSTMGYSPNLDTILQDTRLTFRYTGAFPTYGPSEIVGSGDGMDVIAFKNNILRASHQTFLCPGLVDRTTNQTITQFAYDIEVNCPECTSIYIGGTAPVNGSKARLVAEAPNDLMLYAGQYAFSKQGNTWFLNSNLNASNQVSIDATLDGMRRFYRSFLTTKNNEPVALAQIFSIGSPTQYEDWAFAAFPCIVANLSSLSRQIDQTSGQLTDVMAYRLYSHELAHQYFGLKVKSDNLYWGFYSESFAEYLCLKAIENQFGAAAYEKLLRERYLTDRAMGRKFIHLDAIKNEIDNAHKYYYYPMVLAGLEKTVGKASMFRLLNYMVENVQSTNLNYESLKQAALASGISSEKWTAFENAYVHTDNCLKNLIGK